MLGEEVPFHAASAGGGKSPAIGYDLAVVVARAIERTSACLTMAKVVVRRSAGLQREASAVLLIRFWRLTFLKPADPSKRREATSRCCRARFKRARYGRALLLSSSRLSNAGCYASSFRHRPLLRFLALLPPRTRRRSLAQTLGRHSKRRQSSWSNWVRLFRPFSAVVVLTGFFLPALGSRRTQQLQHSNPVRIRSLPPELHR